MPKVKTTKTMLGVMLSEEETKRIEQLAVNEGRSKSSMGRILILKALEVTESESTLSRQAS